MANFLKKLENMLPARRKHIKDIKAILQNHQELLLQSSLDPNGFWKIEQLLSHYVPEKYHYIFTDMLLLKGKHHSISNYKNFYHDYTNTPPPQNTTASAVCIDCGAHRGIITDIILLCGGISYAFEPNLYLQGFLQFKYYNHPRVILSPNAVSNKFYTTKFMIDEEGILSQGNRIIQNRDSLQESYEVQVIDLSEMLEKSILPTHKRIYLLKLDVEGAEFDILDSILDKKLYQSIDFIVCETHERFFADGDSKMQNLKNRIKEERVENIFLDWF